MFQELTDEKIAASKPFYCGNNDLDVFFHEDVTKFSYNLMGKSYCFVLEDDPSIIVCSFTVSNDSIRVYDLPHSRRDYMKHIITDEHVLSRMLLNTFDSLGFTFSKIRIRRQ